MLAFDDIKPGARLRGLDSSGVAEVVQVARIGADALNLVFRVNGRVSERLVYRGEETSLEMVVAGRAYEPVYVQRFFKRELGFAETAVVFNIRDLLSLAGLPAVETSLGATR